jgi:hypothetical protein
MVSERLAAIPAPVEMPAAQQIARVQEELGFEPPLVSERVGDMITQASGMERQVDIFRRESSLLMNMMPTADEIVHIPNGKSLYDTVFSNLIIYNAGHGCTDLGKRQQWHCNLHAAVVALDSAAVAWRVARATAFAAEEVATRDRQAFQAAQADMARRAEEGYRKEYTELATAATMYNQAPLPEFDVWVLSKRPMPAHRVRFADEQPGAGIVRGPTVKVPEPHKFMGTNSEMVEDSIFAFENYLSGNSIPRDKWPIHGMQLLGGKAQEAYIAFAQPYQQRGGVVTWEQFKETLYTSFTKPDRALAARRALFDMKQTGTVAAYINHVRVLINRAGSPTPTGPDLLELFWKGLSDEAREGSSIDPKSGSFWSSWEELARHCVTLELQKASGTHRKPFTPFPKRHPKVNALQLKRGAKRSPKQDSGGGGSGNGGGRGGGYGGGRGGGYRGGRGGGNGGNRGGGTSGNRGYSGDDGQDQRPKKTFQGPHCVECGWQENHKTWCANHPKSTHPKN